MSLHHLIFIYVVQCRNCTTPIISWSSSKKKTKRKKTSLQLIDICCAMAQLYHPYIEICFPVEGPSLFIGSSLNHLNLHPEYVSNFSRPVFIQSGIYISNGLVFWIRISFFTTPSFSISIYKEKMVPISPFQISFNIGSTSPLDMSTGSRFLLLPLKASFRKILKRKCIQFLPSSLHPWNNISSRHVY